MYRVATAYTQCPKDVMYMELHRPFRNTQFGCNLLVRESFSNQTDNRNC
jgi:hypothetical protein